MLDLRGRETGGREAPGTHGCRNEKNGDGERSPATFERLRNTTVGALLSTIPTTNTSQGLLIPYPGEPGSMIAIVPLLQSRGAKPRVSDEKMGCTLEFNHANRSFRSQKVAPKTPWNS